ACQAPLHHRALPLMNKRRLPAGGKPPRLHQGGDAQVRRSMRSLPLQAARGGAPRYLAPCYTTTASNSHVVARIRLQTTRSANPASGRVRQEGPDQQWFLSVDEARHRLEKWRRRNDNTIRPHTALGNQALRLCDCLAQRTNKQR